MDSNSFIIFGSLNVVFTHSYAYALREMGYDVIVVDIGEKKIDFLALEEEGIRVFEWNSGSARSTTLLDIKSAVKKIFKSLKLDRSKLFRLLAAIYATKRTSNGLPYHLQQILLSNTHACFLFLWSTTAAAHKSKVDEFVQSHGTTKRSFLIVNTYPVRDDYSYDDAPEMSQTDKTYFESFEKILVPTIEMRNLFLKIGYIFPNIEVHPDLLHPRYVAKKLPKLDALETKALIKRPRLIFLGNTNFSERSIDDVSATLRSFAQNGYQVHIQKHPSVNSLDFPRTSLIMFSPFSYEQMAKGLLSEYIAKNEFVFVGYNKMDNARSYVSFPTRLALAVLGNRPILLENKQFVAAAHTYSELYSYKEEVIAIGENTFAVLEPKYDDDSFYASYERIFWTQIHSLIERMVK